jgi:putative membrane protein
VIPSPVVGDEQKAVCWTALALPIAVVATSLLVPIIPGLFADLGYGHLSAHMAQHILTMNLIAPIVAFGLLRYGPLGRISRRNPHEPGSWLALAVALQIGALWFWHAPGVFEWAMAGRWPAAFMHASLFLIALLFWVCVLGIGGHARWKPIAALLITGKLFCLLGVLFVFAPRALYDMPFAHGHSLAPSTLADQQLAGLLMVAACPLTYIVAGVVIATRWILDLESEYPSETILRPAAGR